MRDASDEIGRAQSAFEKDAPYRSMAPSRLSATTKPYFFDYARLPHAPGLLRTLHAACERLADKITRLSATPLDISEYNKRYLSQKLTSLATELQHYSYLLAWSLAEASAPVGRLTICEYGGGTGMISLLAKELGVGTVVYNDIYDVSCHDALVLARALGCEADHYVQGDIDDLLQYLRDSRLSLDAIASYDVIEHIYDIHAFLRTLGRIPGSSLTVVMGSTANSLNRRYVRETMRMHVQYEHEDRKPEWGHKDRDSLRSFLSIRRDMVASIAPQLRAGEIERLARNTRGMMERDIGACVRRYLETGEPPAPPDHPTNTCDPHTGNWQEHLMDPHSLVATLRTAGFEANVRGGYYSCRGPSGLRRVVGRGANLLISMLLTQGLRIAPFMTLYGRKARPARSTGSAK